jgi:hypothetical protein
MKTKKVELDVDFIGEQVALTKDEEKALSEFLQKNKSGKNKPSSSKGKIIKQLI